jgi:glycosyltransferase involved in cell wall biosynthesis
MNNPLVSISIPTLNSSRTLERTLSHIKKQTYKNYEIIIVDNGSTDSTIKIAKKYTSKIFTNKGKLLGSRFIGLQNSNGLLHVFLDSDQVLSPTAIQRAVFLFFKKNHDMLFLEEDSYKPRTIIERLTSLDRKTTHKKAVINPSQSVLLPRVFKTSLLNQAFKKINPELFNIVTLQDHAIIYYECYKLSKNIGYLPQAVFHEEPRTIKELFDHYFSWGIKVAERSSDLPDEYKRMFSSKVNNRNKSVNPLSLDFPLVAPILAIKAFGYYLGLAYSKAKLKQSS